MAEELYNDSLVPRALPSSQYVFHIVRNKVLGERQSAGRGTECWGRDKVLGEGQSAGRGTECWGGDRVLGEGREMGLQIHRARVHGKQEGEQLL